MIDARVRHYARQPNGHHGSRRVDRAALGLLRCEGSSCPGLAPGSRMGRFRLDATYTLGIMDVNAADPEFVMTSPRRERPAGEDRSRR